MQNLTGVSCKFIVNTSGGLGGRGQDGGVGGTGGSGWVQDTDDKWYYNPLPSTSVCDSKQGGNGGDGGWGGPGGSPGEVFSQIFAGEGTRTPIEFIAKGSTGTAGLSGNGGLKGQNGGIGYWEEEFFFGNTKRRNGTPWPTFASNGKQRTRPVVTTLAARTTAVRPPSPRSDLVKKLESWDKNTHTAKELWPYVVDALFLDPLHLVMVATRLIFEHQL